MPVQIGAKAESDFTDPVGMLRDCHRRIERFLGILRTLGKESDGSALSDEHRNALEMSLRYFREGSPRHVQDEEASLFPRLRHKKSAVISAALAVVDRLEQEHSTVEAWHHELDKLGMLWLNQRMLDTASLLRFRALAQQLSELYDEHIRLEDNEVFPLAVSTLPSSDLNAIGREMAERRGARVPAALAASSVKPLRESDPPAD